MNPGFLRNTLIVLFSGGIIYLFFRPWFYFEIAPVTAAQLISLAPEYFNESSVMNQLIYLVFLIPLSSLYILVSVLFGRNSGLMPAKIISLLSSLVFFIIILRFQTSDTMNLKMALACKLTVLLSLMLFSEAMIVKFRKRKA